jgi:TldD protein
MPPYRGSTRRQFLKTAAAVPLLGPLSWAWPQDAPDRAKMADAALDVARKARASFADVRINRYLTESLTSRERRLQQVVAEESFGAGVRVLLDGAWGFAATPAVTPEALEEAADAAVAIARANASLRREPVTLAPERRHVAQWDSGFQRNPFEVPMERKAELLLKINETALKVKGASFVDSALRFAGEQKFYASSEGSRIEQHLIRSHGTFNVTAVDRARGLFQQRRSLSTPVQRGWEYIEEYPWIEEAEQAAHEAVQKLSARPPEPGLYDLVLHPTHLWLTIHENCGHPTELDRAVGLEANFAGTSFLTPDMMGKFQYGSKIVNMVADRTQPHALATIGYDDDGVPAQRWHLVKDGIFVDYQTTREQAAWIGHKRSYGCAHADSWASVTFQRMPNVSLEPAEEDVSEEELIADVRNGILILGDGSFSIDQQRYNFQFGGQVFWAIRNGKKAEMLRDVAYQSRTPDFWNACDGIGGKATYALGGAFNDGKGEPVQSNAVSHGCPVARIRNVRVLNTGAEGGQ